MLGFAKHLIVQLSTRFNLVRPPPSVPPLKQIFISDASVPTIESAVPPLVRRRGLSH
jgi:hypothetical protein